MRLRDVPGYVRDTALRMLPHRARPGLVPVGHPGSDSPVLLTGNFTLTVRRMKEALAGQDVWLLVANSKGINVWCAAGGGHLTHHDVVSALRVFHVADRVRHRELILPQLCATGVERKKIREAGWQPRWGPARLEDLPAFLARGRRVHGDERFMRFPPWERTEMAAMWSVPMLAVASPLLVWLAGAATGLCAAGSVAAGTLGLFLLLPWLRVTGRARHLTFAAFALLAAAGGGACLWAAGAATAGHLAVVAGTAACGMAVVSVDLAGTTPWYGSTLNTFHNNAHIELVEERCTGKSDCVQVCPRDVLHMNGPKRKVDIVRPEQCIQCGACVVQCPEDALRFRYDDGRVAEAGTLRTTRMNMLGRRTLPVVDG